MGAWLALLHLACGPSEAAAERTRLRVFAATSLTEAFEGIERAYEASHPDVDVQLVFAGSQALRVQIEGGAPADVFASADLRHMEALASAGRVEPPQVFAANTLAIAVRRDDPDAPSDFTQLDRAEHLVLGAPEVPAGRYADQLLDRWSDVGGPGSTAFVARVRAQVVSREANVRLARAKVELGEADAAIVYRSDLWGRPQLRGLAPPPEASPEIRYPIAVLRSTLHPADARAFVAFVRSAEGQAQLAEAGFVEALR